MGFYNTKVTAPMPVSQSMLDAAAGKGRGDILTKAADVGINYLGRRERKDYTNGEDVQRILASGTAAELGGLNKSLLTKEANANLDNRLSMEDLAYKQKVRKQQQDVYDRALASEQAVKNSILGTAKSAAVDSRVNNAYEELTKRFKGNYGTGLETDEYTRELDKLNAQAVNAHKQGNIFGTVYDSHAYGQRVMENALRNGATPSEAKAAGVNAENMYEQKLSKDDAARRAQLLDTINAGEKANIKAITDSVSTVTDKTGTGGSKGSSKSGTGSNKAFWTTPAAMNMEAVIGTLKKHGVDNSKLNFGGELKDAEGMAKVLSSAYTTDPKTGKILYFSPKLQSDLLARAVKDRIFAGNQVDTGKFVALIEAAKKDPLLLQSVSSGYSGSKGGRTSSQSVKRKVMSKAQSDAIAGFRAQARNARAAIEREYALPTASSEFNKYFGGGQKAAEPAVIAGSKTNKDGKVYKSAGNDLLAGTVKKTKPEVDSEGGTQTTNSTEGTNDADVLSRALGQSDAQAVENEKSSNVPSLLGGYTEVPQAPKPGAVKPALTAPQQRKRDSWAGKITHMLFGDEPVHGLSATLRDIKDRSMQGAGAVAGAANRTAEFFTQPAVDAYNWSTGNNVENVFGAAAGTAEKVAKDKLVALGQSPEQADKTLLVQELLAPTGGYASKVVGRIPKNASKLVNSTIDMWAKEAKIAENAARRAARQTRVLDKVRDGSKVLPSGPTINLGSATSTFSPVKQQAFNTFVNKFKEVEGRLPTAAEVRTAFGI